MMKVRAMYLFLTNPSLYGLCSVAATWRAEVRDVSGIGITISRMGWSGVEGHSMM
jgi:hypothetical protein